MRPLEPLYPILFLDALMVKMRHEGQVDNRAVYVAIGIDLEGRKDVLGLWNSGHEGAKLWLQVLTELNNRGVKDVFIACVDGLKGFPEAIETVFPQAKVQLCIVHLVAGQFELCELERAQGGGPGSANDFSRGHGGRGRTTLAGVRREVGRGVCADCGFVAEDNRRLRFFH
jgi:transposase-like protein